ncbi:hypothetical protein F4778DRAFT_794735 [Xylariomycetidae sp. FL2044]|nr:hypothetical protein F4778DRAFT_794735 [Xylariomycetidae sp. FL2044]
MHPSTIITLLAAGLASGMSLDKLERRKCHKSGDKWGQNQIYAENLIGKACNEAFVGTDGTSKWKKDHQMQRCYNLDSNLKVDFILERAGDAAEVELTNQMCWEGFQPEIQGCQQGGVSTKGSFTFS